MKKLNFIVVFLCGLFIYSIKAQVGIGTDTPDPSAILDIASENKVLVLPRIDNVSSIENPPKGSFIYDTKRQCISYYKNKKWRCLAGESPGFIIKGDPFIGEILTAEAAGFDIYRKDVSFTYQWYRADDDEGLRQTKIKGATDKTYILTVDDNNKYITVEAIPEDSEEYGDELKADYTERIVTLLVDIPDEKFREYLKKQIPGAFEGEQLKANSELVRGWTSIDVARMTITSLKGIEYFTGLTKLDCSNNRLTALDVTKNTALYFLDCSANDLVELDVRQNTALNFLGCSINSLVELDVTKNTALNFLDCSANDLVELDVTKNTALISLNCGSNDLVELDVTKNTALNGLNCSDNNLIWLDLRYNTLLKRYNQVSCQPLESSNFTVVKWHDNWR